MAIHLRKLYIALTALVLLFGQPQGALAQSEDEQLAQWMKELAVAEPGDAARLTREIERLWSKSGPTALDSLLRRGREALGEDDTEAAIEHFSALTDHAPDFAEGFHARATAYFMTKRYGPALQDLQRTLILNPQHYNALYGLGIMFQELGDYVRAEQAFLMVLDLHPHHERATEALDALKREGIGRTL